MKELDPDFKRPHEWERDAEGFVIEHGDEHSGPQCLVCDAMECRFCNPDFLSEPCNNQDKSLVPIHTTMTDIQKKQRFNELHRLGYIMRSGVVVGWEKPFPKCVKGKCKTRIIERRERGEGVNKRVHLVYECVACLTRSTN